MIENANEIFSSFNQQYHHLTMNTSFTAMRSLAMSTSVRASRNVLAASRTAIPASSLLINQSKASIVASNEKLYMASSKRFMTAGTTIPANVGATGSTGTFLDVKEVTDRVLNVLKNMEKVDKSKLSPKAHFTNDLGLDSLDAVEVVMAFEEEFVIEIPDDIAEKILSCEDAIKFISQHPQAR